MSLSDLRKELKSLRKETMPTPVSRMKKTEVAMELERLRGLGRSAAKKVEETPSAPAALEKVAKKIVEKKVEEKPKKVVEKKVEVPKEEKYVPSKFVKGSQEAKDRMAAIRAKKGTKKSDE